MARPNSTNIKRTISEFHRLGIKSIINVQIPGEHASCGPRLEPSGFTYDPKDLMDAGIFFYNFGWKDYREASMTNILDMVKVLSFALSEGKVCDKQEKLFLIKRNSVIRSLWPYFDPT